MLILTPEEIRKAEEKANGNILSYEEMMENAGRGCAEHIINSYPQHKNIVIICGKGKNGGDGFVIARYMAESEKDVNIICAFNSPSDELSEKNRKRVDGQVNIYDGSHISRHISRLISNADIIVDAVFGIGFKGALPENVKELFRLADNSKAVKIAVDIPSGLSVGNENTEQCFRADETLSMLCFKKEHIYKPYSDFCGKTTVIPIGFECTDGFLKSAAAAEIKELLPKRPFNSNKGTYGKVLIAAGSKKMPGAAVISAKGALSLGAGLVFLAFPDCIYSTVTSHLTECVFRPLPSEKTGEFDELSIDTIEAEYASFPCIATGPGLTTGTGPQLLLEFLIKNYNGKLIIDADGINIISRNIDILKETSADILLTPHPGEMARLTGLSVEEINSNRIKVSREFAQKYNATVLLKGANTVIASPDADTYINPTGSPALSRGGSGDLLTGIIASLTAQGISLCNAAVAGAYIHGLAGDMAEKRYTSFCSTIERIYDCIPEALSQILQG